ncbi:translation initiation factor eIF-2B subunit epsilon isoform X2 [Dendroctonus ponderosae]|uniref:translation initiation factor eIF-2B subunit epsilon isoform X2 n=1 Tax=Dendroctonus ponderosae TaxID=77166 RepID=UPI0020359C91|nr:translation initiation factor eIF-2B subunit epsilon isoform X2 [Dendroctonus ponderosae]
MSKKREIMSTESYKQAVLIADTFENEFVPISNDIPLSLFPLANKPLIDYTLEFLSLGGIDETFLFCCKHAAKIKAHIKKCMEEAVGWTLSMKVHLIVSESCRSFGDCLRDLDAKGHIRGDFILLEPGVVSNISLLPLLKRHSAQCKADKGTAMTLVFQECGSGHTSLSPEDEVCVALSQKNRVLFHKKTKRSNDKRVDIPLEIFLENPVVSIRHDIRDTHITICSSSVLPLFIDNFDFQTKDDFVRGLLINEDILGSTIYSHILKGSNYAASVHNWRSYQSISMELKDNWIYPLTPSSKRLVPNESIVSPTSKVALSAILCRCIVGPNVVIGEKVTIQDAFIFENTHIEDSAIVSLSVIGSDCLIKKGAKVTVGSVLGKGVVINENSLIENTLVQATESEYDLAQPEDKLGDAAYRLRADEDEEDLEMDKILAKRLSRLHFYDATSDTEYETEEELSDSDVLSRSDSPPLDDTKVFFTEVIDSLARGFEDKLLCDNLILEVNSSRYAYNITLEEVNYYVIKAILIMSYKLPTGGQYFSKFAQLLNYFTPVLKNYIKSQSSMGDCLQAVEDVAESGEPLSDKWAIFVVKYLYEKDYLSEDAILKWFANVSPESKMWSQVNRFVEWLQEAEEEDSSEEESE